MYENEKQYRRSDPLYAIIILYKAMYYISRYCDTFNSVYCVKINDKTQQKSSKIIIEQYLYKSVQY